MQYMGGKTRIAKKLTETMLSYRNEEDTYVEPFVGGASVLSYMAPAFSTVVASDVMEDLATMWSAVGNGWQPPAELSLEEYEGLRVVGDETDPLSAFAAYGCSFGGIRWNGYAKHRPDKKHPNPYPLSARNSILRKAKGLQGVSVERASFFDIDPVSRSLLYCDPPYDGTSSYPGAPAWDAGRFWARCREWVEAGSLVFVSEYKAPSDWVSVYSQQTPVSLSSTTNTGAATEHLWMHETGVI